MGDSERELKDPTDEEEEELLGEEEEEEGDEEEEAVEEEEEEGDPLENRLGAIERQLAASDKRNQDKDDFIETLKKENARMRQAQGVGGDPGAGFDDGGDGGGGSGGRGGDGFDKESAAFIARRVKSIREQYPDQASERTPEELAEFVRNSGEFELFERLYRNEQDNRMLAQILMDQEREHQVQAINDPEFDVNDPEVVGWINAGLPVADAHLLYKAKRGAAGGAPRRKPSRAELAGRKPRGTPSRGKGGGARGGSGLTKEQRQAAREANVSEEDYAAAMRISPYKG